jgi:hypothetical protein
MRVTGDVADTDTSIRAFKGGAGACTVVEASRKLLYYEAVFVMDMLDVMSWLTGPRLSAIVRGLWKQGGELRGLMYLPT